jgi:signal transduction histidine kinase
LLPFNFIPFSANHAIAEVITSLSSLILSQPRIQLCYTTVNPIDSGKAGMDKTLIEIPTELLHAAKLTPEEARTELAIRLYQLHRLNDKQACELAGDSKAIETLAWTNRETGHFEMDDFLSWASHDLKTPLNAVIGFTKVVIKGYDGPVTETQVTDLTTAGNSGQRMLGLINNLVEIARINNGHITLAREEANIANLISEYADRWRSQNPAKPLMTDIQIDSPTFQVDFQQLRQIITHLLTFAALRLSEGSISLSASDTDQGLNVTIQSTGKKAVDKSEMDSAMHAFITSSLIKLHGGSMGEPFETDDGLLLNFSLPR